MKYLILVMSILLTKAAFGQFKKPSFEKFINDECVSRGSVGPHFGDETDNHPFVFAIAFSFDNKGAIDTLYFSDKVSETTKRRYGLNKSLLLRIKDHRIQYPQYASKVVLSIFYYRKSTDKSADYASDFLGDFSNLIPQEIMDKPVIILKPFVNQYSYIVN